VLEVQSKLDKYASEACSLVLKKQAEEEAQTYAGSGFKNGIIGGATLGVAYPLYNWAARGVKPGLPRSKGSVVGALIKGSLSTSLLGGVVGGLGGGMVKRKAQPTQEQSYYV
jgi:hypothetical protein